MRIEIVQLENIRSHQLSTVPFSKGFNCLVGGVGCGKSSILHAIDFALFGDPIGRTFEYILREDANTGKVIMQFVQNGNTYKISRGLKRRGKSIGQDLNELKLFEGETEIAGLKSDAVAEQLKTITGLDKELFREIVWVRQEHLKELLNATPRDRQTRLDELFGLSDYELAWNNIAGYQKKFEGEKEAHEKDPDVTGIDKLSSEYNKTVEDFSLIQIQIEDTSNKLASAKKALETADMKLRKLEEVKAHVEELKRKETQALANLTNLKNTLESTTKKIEAKKTTLETLKQRLSALEKQVESSKTDLKQIGILPDQPMDELRSYLDTFDNQISSLKGEQESSSRAIRENQKRNSQLTTENRCPLCLQSLSDEYKNDLMQRILQDNTTLQKETNKLQQDIEQLQNLKNKADTAFSNLQKLIPTTEELKSRIHDESEALAEISNELDEKKNFETELRRQLEAVQDEISRLDLSELEIAKTTRDQAFRLCCSLESDLRSKENRKQDLATRLDEIRERIDQAQQKIERMERILKLIEIIGDVRDAYRNIQPKLRREFVKVLRNFAQQVLDNLVGSEGPFLNILIDETYSPYIKSEGGAEREVQNLSGGERTLLAFAYRLGLGQLIMQSRTGHGLSMLLLDEPTESLGREDGSIDRLAEAISRFKAIEQIIAVTHSEAFAEKAEHVIRVEKEAGVSKVSVER